jgi:hypothetical protein
MTITKISLISIFSLVSILFIGSVVQVEPEIESELILGEDCETYHGGYYLEIDSVVDPFPPQSSNTNFIVILMPTSSELIFNATLTLFQLPTGVEISQGNSTQSFYNFSTKQKASWNLTGIQSLENPLLVNITLLVHVPQDFPIHPGYTATYHIILNHPFVQESLSLIDYILSLKWIDIDLSQEIFAYLSYTLLVFSIITGMPQIHKEIGSMLNRRIRVNTIRRFHCHLSKATAIIAGIHVLVVTLSPTWFYIIELWILPTLYFPPDLLAILNLRESKFGLELGRWAGFALLFTVATGVDFGRITRKLGRKRTLIFQQISYIALVMVGLHALLLGTLTRQITILRLFIVTSLILVIMLRVYLLLKQRHSVPSW